MICRPHKKLSYPVNKNVPATALRLGEILAIYEKTGALNAPVIDGGFEVVADENGRVDWIDNSTPHNYSKLDMGKESHDALFPAPTPVPTPAPTPAPTQE